jgi:hypothetical protein
MFVGDKCADTSGHVEWYLCFRKGRVAGVEDEVLVSASFLVVQICYNIAVFFNNQNIQKRKFGLTDIHCELNTCM